MCSILKKNVIFIVIVMTTSNNQKLPRICLNMIVKNEAHVIKETLENIYNNVDYYVINDTGSTDNTKQVIKEFFDSKGINGEIYDHEFRTCTCQEHCLPGCLYKKYSFFHFGWNRSYALEKCKGKSEYIFVMDADDIMMGEFKIPQKLDKDGYHIKIGKYFTYQRVQLFRNDPSLNWQYVGGLHEYPNCNKPTYATDVIEGDYYMESRRLGDRSKDPQKYLRDALAFEEMLQDEPNNDRYMFYLAQSWFDYKNYKKAIDYYGKRIAMKGWYEEVYHSYFKIAEAMEFDSFSWQDVEKAYLDAHYNLKKRAEPLFRIADHYRLKDDFKNCYKFAKMGVNIKLPKDLKLFIFVDIYEYKLKDLVALSAYYMDNYVEAYRYWKLCLEYKDLPEHESKRIKNALEFAKQKLNQMDKKTCCIYVGNVLFDKNHAGNKIIDELSKIYKVYLVGNRINCEQMTNCIILTKTILQSYNNEQNKVVSKKYNELVPPKYMFDVLILLDSLNYFYDNIQINYNKIILLQFNEHFKFVLDNGLTVYLYNDDFVNEKLNKIDKILTINGMTKNNLQTGYGLNKGLIMPYGKYFFENMEDEENRKSKKLIKIKSNIVNDVNGFIYVEPEYIKTLTLNYKLYPFAGDIITEFYTDVINYLPECPQPYLFLIKHYSDVGSVDKGLKLIDKATTLPNISEEMKDILLFWKGKCAYRQNKYNDCFDIVGKILERNNIPGLMREPSEKLRDSCIDHIMNDTWKYNRQKVMTIKNNVSTKKQKRIILSITTCKRYDLFEKTINSFLFCCLDLNLIDHWLCVDDNSSDEDRQKMKSNYPFFDFVCKDETQKGHYKSMNIIHNFITKYDSEYLLHLEDDFHFIEKRNYITQSINILTNSKSDEKYGQLLFNRNYSEVDRSKSYIVGGFAKTCNNLRYVEHEYYPTNGAEYQEFLKRNQQKSTVAYWPHFSFRPSIMKCSMLRDVGCFYNTPHFEMQYAQEYIQRGYKSAFLDTFSCIHTGKKTWEKTPNAYNMNQTNQFSLNDDDLAIYTIDNNIDNFRTFKQMMENKLPYFNRKTVDNISNLNDAQKMIFKDNDFNYRRDVLNYMMTYVGLVIDCNKKNMIVYKENTIPNNSFDDGFKYLLNMIQIYNYDIIFIKYGQDVDPNVSFALEKYLDNKWDIFDNTYGCYVVSLNGLNKIKERHLNNGIKNMNCFANVDNLNVFVLNRPLLVQINNGENLDIKINVNNCKMKEYDGFKFYSQMDSFGNDVGYFPDKTIDELAKLCKENGYAGFNTNKWIKKTIKPENEFIGLFRSNDVNEGLYVNIL